MDELEKIIAKARNCVICADQLPFAPNPCFWIGAKAKIIIIGQAPGLKVQQTGIVFNDDSGDRLRNWLGVSREEFYDLDNFAIIPMGFCYPGKAKTGDKPPMKICAPTWHEAMLTHLSKVKLILLVGQYSQKYYLKGQHTLTQRVKNFQDFIPEYFPLPHPSARNFIWLRRNPWFEKQVVPELQKLVREVLSS